MIQKHTALSFAFCALMVSSTVSRSETATQATQEKTTGQRIVSALAHTALLVPCAGITTILCATVNDFSREPLFFTSLLITNLYGTYSGAAGIYKAIKNNPEEPEAPVSKMAMAKGVVLGMAALVVLHDCYTLDNKEIIETLPSITSLYAFYTSGKTMHRAIQQRRNSADLQAAKKTEPEATCLVS